MKTFQKWWRRLYLTLTVTMLALRAQASNPCIESPSTNGPYCMQQGTLMNSYTLTPTNITAGVGQFIISPTVSNLAMTNGLETNYVSYICTPTLNGWQTSSIPYIFGNLYFAPSLPTIYWTPGTYSYTAKVNVTGSPCGPVTNTLGTVTVTVSSNNPDVLIDVDFGGKINSAKTGYAAIGDSTGDFWNGYARTNVASGSLTNLVTAEGNVSLVGLLVTNLPTLGTNGSTDAMYNDYLGTNATTATVTLTNLPVGTWNVYLYASDGNFTLSVGGTNYGTQSCYDQPLSSVLWQQGVQYVVFQNVAVTNGQPVTITVNRGINGTAMLSGLQIASLSHTPLPQFSVPTTLGMVAWWRAEGNLLDSIGTNNGSISAGSITYTNGEVRQGFNFNGGTNRITVPDAPQLNFGSNQDFSIEAWIQPQTATTTFGIMSIVDKRIASGSSDSPNGYECCVINGQFSCRFMSVTFGPAGPDMRDGHFHHVAMTLSRNSTTGGKLYVDGVVVLTFNPTAYNGSLINTQPLLIGNHAALDLNCFFKGVIDEVSLYSRALATNEISAIYNAGSTGKTAGPTQDSDYDGVSDLQELADRTDPNNPNSVPQIRLGYWPFDNTNTWVGSAGQLPLLATNVTGVPSWNTNAVLIDSTNPAILSYRDVETNGNANINLRNGTVRFWFKPDWSSTNAGGAGPQSEGRLIELGTKGSTNGWWGLVVGSSGTNIYFGTQTNSTGTLTTNLTTMISWSSNIWHQIVLTYNSTNTSLYIDGQSAMTNGTGVAYYPGLAVRTNGFTIGSDSNGTNQARGTFDELETFNYSLSASDVSSNYQATSNLDSDGDGLPNLLEYYLGTNPYGLNTSYGLSNTNGLQIFTPLK